MFIPSRSAVWQASFNLWSTLGLHEIRIVVFLVPRRTSSGCCFGRIRCCMVLSRGGPRGFYGRVRSVSSRFKSFQLQVLILSSITEYLFWGFSDSEWQFIFSFARLSRTTHFSILAMRIPRDVVSLLFFVPQRM